MFYVASGNWDVTHTDGPKVHLTTIKRGPPWFTGSFYPSLPCSRLARVMIGKGSHLSMLSLQACRLHRAFAWHCHIERADMLKSARVLGDHLGTAGNPRFTISIFVLSILSVRIFDVASSKPECDVYR